MRAGTRGLTLVELLVAVSILTLLLGLVIMALASSSRQSRLLQLKNRMQNELALAAHVMQRELRLAGYCPDPDRCVAAPLRLRRHEGTVALDVGFACDGDMDVLYPGDCDSGASGQTPTLRVGYKFVLSVGVLSWGLCSGEGCTLDDYAPFLKDVEDVRFGYRTESGWQTLPEGTVELELGSGVFAVATYMRLAREVGGVRAPAFEVGSGLPKEPSPSDLGLDSKRYADGKLRVEGLWVVETPNLGGE